MTLRSDELPAGCGPESIETASDSNATLDRDRGACSYVFSPNAVKYCDRREARCVQSPSAAVLSDMSTE